MGGLPVYGDAKMKQLFNQGQIVAIPGALEMAEQGVNLLSYLYRHLSGD